MDIIHQAVAAVFILGTIPSILLVMDRHRSGDKEPILTWLPRELTALGIGLLLAGLAGIILFVIENSF